VSEAHPVADCYQWTTPDQIDALAADISKYGLKTPITRLKDGRIIDGRNRELACLVARVEPQYDVCGLTDDTAILAHIRSANDERRHSSESQRAMTAARLSNLTRGSNQYAPKVDGAWAPSISQQTLAKQFRISCDLIKRARKVLRLGVGALASAVDENRLDVTTAARVARLSAQVQEAVAGADDPKAAAYRALHPPPPLPSPTPLSPLVPDGGAFIRLAPQTPKTEERTTGERGVPPGLPKRLTDGRVWRGWLIDIRLGLRIAYLIPGLRGGWFVVVMNITAGECHTHHFALKSWAAMLRLCEPEGYGFDVWSAYWQPTKRFSPSAINPLYLDPEYAHTLPEELKRFVEDEKRRQEEWNVDAASTPEGATF
jgi:hypothetical protein